MQVSSDLTLQDVKLRLLELLGLHPMNAELYIRGAPAADDSATLAGPHNWRHACAIITNGNYDEDTPVPLSAIQSSARATYHARPVTAVWSCA